MAVNVIKKPKIKASPLVQTGSAVVGDSEIKQAVGHALVELKTKGVKHESTEKVATVLGQGPFANVGVQATRTISDGNYGSAKVQVSINVPCEVNETEIEATFAFAQEWVYMKMEILTKEFS